MASLHLAADQLVEETQTDAAGIGVTPRLEERPSADSAKKWFGVTIVRPPSYLTSRGAEHHDDRPRLEIGKPRVGLAAEDPQVQVTCHADGSIPIPPG